MAVPDSKRHRQRALARIGSWRWRTLTARWTVAAGWTEAAVGAGRAVGGTVAAGAGAGGTAARRMADEVFAVVHALQLATELFAFFAVELFAAGIVRLHAGVEL